MTQMTTRPTDAEVAEVEKSGIPRKFDPETSIFDRTFRSLCAAARDRNRLEAENAKLREALKQAAVWLRNGDYDTRGGLIEMSRLAGVCESALSELEATNG